MKFWSSKNAMIFIDGTNLFYRLAGSKLKLTNHLITLIKSQANEPFLRTYLYTSEPEYEKALKIHGEYLTLGIRVIFGQSIPLQDGNNKEKGVDAMLVADLIYHAAMKNIDYALLVTVDTDFVHAINRVEDFGCRTGVMGICATIPVRLKSAVDDIKEISEHDLLHNGNAVKIK